MLHERDIYKYMNCIRLLTWYFIDQILAKSFNRFFPSENLDNLEVKRLIRIYSSSYEKLNLLLITFKNYKNYEHYL